MLIQTSLVSLLALATSLTTALQPALAHSGHANGRSAAAHHQRRFGSTARRHQHPHPPLPPVVGNGNGNGNKQEVRDVHGRQLPGTIAMRKRSDGSTCKIRPAASASASTPAAVGGVVVGAGGASSLVGVVASPVVSLVSSILLAGPPASTSAAVTSTVAAEEDEQTTTSATPTTTTSVAAASTSSVWVAPSPTTTTTSTSAAAAATTKASSSGANTQFTPNGNKAGISAGDSFDFFKDHIGWWYDWTPDPSGHSSPGVTAVSMLWGGGTADSTDATRLADFRSLTWQPDYVLGFEEPDCKSGSGSADMSVASAAKLWNELIVPHGERGALLGSPSMCKQLHETFLEPFSKQISRPWDITNIHINKNSMAGVKASIDYYYTKYQRPLWVSEFACVDDSSNFIPCTDQGQIDQFILDIVDLFEADDRVAAYAFSNGYGLGDVWPMWRNNGLTNSGKTYLKALQRYH